MDVLAQLPAPFFEVPYVGALVPGVQTHLGLSAGGNCQRYAYAVLEHFALAVPPLRSSDLWRDEEATLTVEDPEPLDLVLFAPTEDAYGAHVGVHVGDTKVLHLCQEVGYPAVWDFADFAARDRYRVRIGFKRVRRL